MSLCNTTTYNKLYSRAYVVDRDSITWQLIGCAIVTLFLWLTVVFSLRYSLKLLLMYKGWMYEQRGKGVSISTSTKLWIVFVRILSGWNTPRLYSFQGSLPRLPLPSVHDTMTRVSRAIRLMHKFVVFFFCFQSKSALENIY